VLRQGPAPLADRSASRGREPALQPPTRPLDRRRLLADHKLCVGEEQVGVEFEGELLGILRGIDRAFGLSVPHSRFELPKPFAHDRKRVVAYRARVGVHLGRDRREEAAARIDVALDIPQEALREGGQAGSSSHIRNLPGFTWGIGGYDLAYRACEQAWLFGANMVFARRATSLRASGIDHVVQVAGGQEISARTVVLATGVSWRRLGIPRLEELIGAGVFYGAAASEARAMAGKHVCVVGAGNSAGQAAAHLAKYADEVELLVRGDSLGKSMSEYLIVELRGMSNVSVRLGVELVDGEGEDQLRSIVIREESTNTVEQIPTAGLFVMIGAEPHTEWLDGTVERDERGSSSPGTTWTPTAMDRAAGRSNERPLLLETGVPVSSWPATSVTGP
jgi:thioredoxin reductase